MFLTANNFWRLSHVVEIRRSQQPEFRMHRVELCYVRPFDGKLKYVIVRVNDDELDMLPV